MSHEEGPHKREWLKQRRIDLGFSSRSKLAEHMTTSDFPVNQGPINLIENGRVHVPGQPFLEKYAHALGMTQAEILYATGAITKNPTPNANPFEIDDPRHEIVDLLHCLSDEAIESIYTQTVFLAKNTSTDLSEDPLTPETTL